MGAVSTSHSTRALTPGQKFLSEPKTAKKFFKITSTRRPKCRKIANSRETSIVDQGNETAKKYSAIINEFNNKRLENEQKTQ